MKLSALPETSRAREGAGSLITHIKIVMTNTAFPWHMLAGVGNFGN